jgi:hypothetical protein
MKYDDNADDNGDDASNISCVFVDVKRAEWSNSK